MNRNYILILFLLAVISSCGDNSGSIKEIYTGNFAMLEGTWEDVGEKQKFIEQWTFSGDSSLKGYGFVLFENDTVLIEHLRIEKVGNSWVYFAGISGHEGKESIAFPMSSRSSEKKLIFENLSHDFPQRIIYEEKNDTIMEVGIEGKENGNFRRRKLSYVRRKE
jgi:hypothetical protein